MFKKLFWTAAILFLTGCAASPSPPNLTPEQQSRFENDQAFCTGKAEDSARGFGVGGITWTRKRDEIYNHCMTHKGWEVE
ncbi:MAG: hypothetical protein ACE5E9_06780 [Nitrospinaceae bacterium]